MDVFRSAVVYACAKQVKRFTYVSDVAVPHRYAVGKAGLLMKKNVALGLLWLFGSLGVRAQGIATDDAGDAVYDDGWQQGDNGGSEWQAWSMGGSGNAGYFVGTSQSNGFNNGNIDTDGRAWGLWANGGGMVSASRVYGDGTNLFGCGYTISLDMDTGFIDAGSRVGFSIIGTGDSRTYGDISVYFTGGGTNYIVSQGSWYWITTYDTGIPFDSKGLHVEIDIGKTNNFTCRLTPSGGSTVTINGNAQAGNLHVLELFSQNAGAGSTNDVFFNNLRILPPPRITDLAVADGTNVTVSFLPRPELKNAVWACGDLVAGNWVPVATNLTGTGLAELQVNEALAADVTSRYYRIRSAP